MTGETETDSIESMRNWTWMACEAYFNGMVKWPSFGGTYEDLVEGISSLESRDVGQIVTIGLRANCDERVSYTECCTAMGNITGLLHIIGSRDEPAEASEKIWQKIVNIDQEGRQKGFYVLEYTNHFLFVF
jgi:hypothetical protein